MLKWLAQRFSSEETTAGSLGSAKNVRALLEQLERETPQRAIRSLSERVSEVARQGPASANDCLGLRQVDEFAQRPLDALWGLLLTDGRGQTVSSTVWDTLTKYYRSVHSGYWHYLASIKKSDKLSEKGHADALVSASRALTALARYMLLLRMRYQTAPQEVWSLFNSLVAWVIKRGSLSAELVQYPGTELSTTIEREMLVALLFEVAPTGNLLPAQMHALDRLLRLYVGYYRIADSYDEQSRPFGHEPSRNEPPRRWLKGLPVRPGVRFFGVGGAYVEICNALEKVRGSNQLPAWLSGTRCTVDDYQALLERLVAAWSLQPPQRRQRRDPCEGEILVAYDWGDIQRLVKFSELAKSGRSLAYDTDKIVQNGSTAKLRIESAPSDSNTTSATCSEEVLTNLVTFERSLDHDVTEPWSLIDLSEDGLGATAPGDCTWVKVGMMVAYRRPDSPDWQIAFVRRLNRLADNRLAVGMTKSPGLVSAARLRLGVGSVDYSRAINRNDPVVEYDTLMLQEPACKLLIPIGVVDTTWKYTLTAKNRRTIIKMDKSIERGLNFEQVEISVVEAARAA